MQSDLPVTLHGESAILRPGMRMTRQVANAYRDSPAATVSQAIQAIRQGQPWREVVRREYAETNPWLHQIIVDRARVRFFDEHPFPPNSLVLDVGAGWGQITLPLSAHHRVVAVEPTPERLEFIMAAAEQELRAERIYFLQADFIDVEFGPVFDRICCIGVLEWVAKFRPDGDPRAIQLEFLRRLRASLKPGGQCIVGIENRLGLKYVLGARDDHSGLRQTHVFDATLAASRYRAQTEEPLRVFTYSLAEYDELFRQAGFSRISAFGAYPDYKLPEVIIPLDPPGTLSRYILEHDLPPDHDGLDGHLLPNQDELRSHYRSLAAMQIAHVFAPSFFFTLG
jgi:2-polyprenyl-3-methyl-5-hydroxy-6-metoxy-1,4-benzoquinol methylase